MPEFNQLARLPVTSTVLLLEVGLFPTVASVSIRVPCPLILSRFLELLSPITTGPFAFVTIPITTAFCCVASARAQKINDVRAMIREATWIFIQQSLDSAAEWHDCPALLNARH